MNPRERKRRLLRCLALYLLFAFIPGLHAALHPVSTGPDNPLQGPLLAELTAACPDGCENPQHRHLRGTHSCPVCKTGWSPVAIPHAEQRGLALDHGRLALAHGDAFSLRAPDIRIEHARAPPRSLLLQVCRATAAALYRRT